MPEDEHKKHTPIVSEAQRGFFGAEIARKKEGKEGRTDMSEETLAEHLHEAAGKDLPTKKLLSDRVDNFIDKTMFTISETGGKVNITDKPVDQTKTTFHYKVDADSPEQAMRRSGYSSYKTSGQATKKMKKSGANTGRKIKGSNIEDTFRPNPPEPFAKPSIHQDLERRDWTAVRTKKSVAKSINEFVEKQGGNR